MKTIKKVAVSPIPEINGSVVDTFNVEDKTTNAPSINLIQGKILWENPNSTNDFVAQTIELNSNEYDLLKIFYKQGKNVNTLLHEELIKGFDTRLSVAMPYYIGSDYVSNQYRDFTRKSDTSYEISIAKITYGSTSTKEATNLIIPVYVIGYKTGLFN